MTAYATRKDVYRYGLARGTLVGDARTCTSLASTDEFSLDGHGFEDDDAVMFRAADGGSLSAPLVAGTTYYVKRQTESTFKVAATASGNAINLTTDGSDTIVAIALPFDEVLEFYSRFVDGFLPAHLVPLTSPYPITVTALVAELTAKKLLLIAGQTSVALTEAEVSAKAQLERWAKGLPLRDSAATAPANLAVNATLTGEIDPRGWGSTCLP